MLVGTIITDKGGEYKYVKTIILRGGGRGRIPSHWEEPGRGEGEYVFSTVNAEKGVGRVKASKLVDTTTLYMYVCGYPQTKRELSRWIAKGNTITRREGEWQRGSSFKYTIASGGVVARKECDV